MSTLEKALIEKVKSVDLLYNSRSRLYKNNEKKIMSWENISKQLGVGVMQCRQRWKSLRDRFVREHRKVLSSSGQSKIWVHYNQMLFLKDYLLPGKYTPVQKLSINCPSPTLPEVEIKCESIEEVQLNAEDDPLCKREPITCNTDEEYVDYSDGGNFSYEDGSISTEMPSKRSKPNDEDSFNDCVGRQTYDINESIERNQSSKSTEETENTLFMKMIAKKMDLLPLVSQGSLQIEILTMVNNEIKRVVNKK